VPSGRHGKQKDMASLFGGVLELSHVGHRSPLIGEKRGVEGGVE